MNKKYLVVPGFVDSKMDADLHFISGQKLIQLYGVDKRECIFCRRDEIHTYRGSGLKLLEPQYNGKDYILSNAIEIDEVKLT
jgi:hypothetical protein